MATNTDEHHSAKSTTAQLLQHQQQQTQQHDQQQQLLHQNIVRNSGSSGDEPQHDSHRPQQHHYHPQQDHKSNTSCTMSPTTTTTGAAANAAQPHNKSITEKMIVHVMAGFREVCLVTAALPLATLFCCFVGAIIFQADEVHETHCRVFNIIPSISAITGVSPQRYFWRISIALHIGPRFLITAAYHNQYTAVLNRQRRSAEQHASNGCGDGSAAAVATGQRLSRALVSIVFWLHIVEVAALLGVTYVSNKENYPLHEKIFVVFMTCSLLHMVTTIYLTNHLYPVTKSSSAGSTNSQNGEHIVGNSIDVTDAEHLHLIHYALRWKRRLFWLSIASTIGMIVHFARHRWYCHDLAFSWFALCEYVIACSNLAFHCTTIWDFPGEQLIVARGTGKLQRPPLHEHQPQQQQKKCT